MAERVSGPRAVKSGAARGVVASSVRAGPSEPGELATKEIGEEGGG